MVRRAQRLALSRGLGHADVWHAAGGRPAYRGNDDAAAREIDPRSGARTDLRRDPRLELRKRGNPIEASRLRSAPQMTRVVVAIDPAVTSGEQADETGIANRATTARRGCLRAARLRAPAGRAGCLRICE